MTENIKIGVISDTHDHRDNILYFVNKFISEKVSTVFHCGDYVAPFVKNWFQGLKDANIPFYGVFGNNDGEREGLKVILGEVCNLKFDFFEKELFGKKITMFHHLSPSMVEALAKSGNYDIILKGHTHQRQNEKIGKTLILNPGEGCGYLTGKASAAIVNLNDLSVQFLEK
jgi:putative phosphoesterase